MSVLFKYGTVLASGLAIGLWISGPMSVELVARLARTDATSIVVDNAVSRTRPEEIASAVDPTSASRVNEELDYLIARRVGTLEGWQAFLAAHAVGGHADSAMAEIEKLMLLVKASEPAAAAVSDRVSPETDAKSEIAGSSPPSEGVARPSYEACNDGGSCQGDSSGALSSDELSPIADEPDPGGFRAQVASLADSSATTAAQPGSSAKVDPGSKRRATAGGRTASVSSHVMPRRRERRCAFGFGCHWNARALPPILQALFNVKTKRSARVYGQMIADSSSGGARGR